MKIEKTIAATLVISAALMSGSASATTVNDVTSSANLNITVKDGVATLFGHVDSNFDSILAAAAAAKIDGVDTVRNLVTFSN